MIMMVMMVVVIIAIVLVKGLLFVEDAALLGALPLEELVVDSALLPCHLLLGIQPQHQRRLLLLLLGLLRLRWRWVF